MKESTPGETGFVLKEQATSVSYIDAFNLLVEEKLLEPDRPKRGFKIYQKQGYFRQYLKGGTQFIYQGDLDIGIFYFTVQKAVGDVSIEFGVEGDEIVRRTFSCVPNGDFLVVEESERKIMTPEEARELIKIIGNPLRVITNNLPDFINFEAEGSQIPANITIFLDGWI